MGRESRRRPRNPGAAAGMALMGIAGVGGGGLVAWFTGDRVLNGGTEGETGWSWDTASFPIIVFQSTLFTVVVAVGLWLTRNRGWRAFAVGLAGCWSALLLAVFGALMVADDTSDNAPTLRDSGTRGFYLGKEVDGYPVNQNRRAGDLGAAGVTVGYGQPCPEGPEGCFSEVEVSTLTFSREYVVTWGCERLAPVMGVPTVRLDWGLLLFTRRLMVLIDADRKPIEADINDGNVTRALVLASRLRPLERSAVLGSLPPPDPDIQTFVDDACGPQE